MSEATVTDEEKDEKDDAEEEEEEEDEKESSPPPAKASPASGPAYERKGSGLANIWTIMKREIGAYLASPVAYILICLTLVGVGLYFFFYDGGTWQADRASMSRLVGSSTANGGPNFLPMILCALTAPLFTMRALSEEKRMGTIELLITMPVKDSEVILGKYFAALFMVVVQLLLVFAYPLVMFLFPWHMGAFDWGPFYASMLGLFLMSAASIAIGMMFSSMTESQILAFFATSASLAGLYVIGSLVQTLKGLPGDIIAFLSFQSRYEPFSRGLIDTRAVVYFLSIAIFGTLVAFRNLESRKWN